MYQVSYADPSHMTALQLYQQHTSISALTPLFFVYLFLYLSPLLEFEHTEVSDLFHVPSN